MTAPPLTGLRIIDLTSVVVGPAATQWLADYGAEVIKVEAPGGDILRAMGGESKSGRFSPKFLNLNRNKRSLCIDLKHPAAEAVTERLIKSADVVITNLRPDALERLGLDARRARALRPDLIYCSIVGFDRRGRYRDKPAYDTIIQGAAGVAAAHERHDGTPNYVPMTIADHIVAFIAVQCILLAQLHRERTGEGQHIEVPMFENMAAFVLSEHMGQRVFVGSDGPTGDLRVLNPMARPIPTSDGYVCVSANTDRQAFALFEAIGRPELKDDPRFRSVEARRINVDAYHRLRDEALSRKTTAEWVAVLDRLDVPAMPYHSFEGVLEDPQLADVGLFEEIDHPVEGPIRNIALPNRFSPGWDESARPAPALGADTCDILGGLGFSADETAALVKQGVVVDGG